MRWNQTWKCLACGHVKMVEINYSKTFTNSEPLWRKSMRARCTSCGVRGRCQIEEAPAAKPEWGARHVP